MRSIVVVSSAIVGVFLLSLPAVAQQKTVRACQAEWRANKDANQAKGITEKAYVTQCRAAAPATTTMAPAAPPPAAGGQKTVRACQAEWRANKDANQARGITLKAYVAQCRTGGTVAAPAQAPAPPHLHLHRQERRHLHQLRRHRRRPPQLPDRPRRHRRVRTNIRRKARPECDA